MVKRILLSLCAVLLLSGCLAPISPLFPDSPTAVPGTILPFEVVMQNALSQYAGTGPALYLVTSSNDAQVVADLLWDSNSKQFLEWVQQLEAGQALLALFNVPRPMGSHAIRAHQVILHGNTLYVYARICHYQMAPAVEIQDFQIVQMTLPPEAPPAAELTPVLVTYNVKCL